MRPEEPRVLSGAILEEDQTFTLSELCSACSVRAVCVVELVEEGIIEPLGRDPAQWRFSGASLLRMRTVLRLQRDLALNLPGAALVMDLLDEIDRLKRRARLLEY
jgi:chaperone modulatory protein CbpM